MENAKPLKPHANHSFLFWWVLANIVGLPALTVPYGIGYLLLGYVVVMGDGMSIGLFGYTIIFMILTLGGALIGAWLGFLQWFPLKAQIPQSGKWIPVSALGGAIGVPVSVLVYISIAKDGIYYAVETAFVTFGIVLGLTIGIAQWSVLRRHVEGAGWWILVLPVCFALGIFFFLLSNASPVFNILATLIGIGCFTGIVLGLLLQFPELLKEGQ